MITTKLICRTSDGICVAAYSDELSPDECLNCLAQEFPGHFAVVPKGEGGFGSKLSRDGKEIAPPPDEAEDATAGKRQAKVAASLEKIREGTATLRDVLSYLQSTLQENSRAPRI